jgi:hypothetical protein
MSDDTTLEQLRRDVQYLKDVHDIRAVTMRHSRGVDRHDAELMVSCYHEEALVKHGNSSNLVKGPDYGEWSNEAHAGRFAIHSHQITNQTFEIDGDTAYCESYGIVAYLSPDEKRTSLAFCRYIDQLERRDGAWRIVARRGFLDLALEGDATYHGNPRGTPIDQAMAWSRQDPSYQRPIDLSTPSPQWT